MFSLWNDVVVIYDPHFPTRFHQINHEWDNSPSNTERQRCSKMQVSLTSSLKNIYRKFLLSLKIRVPGCYLSFWLWILLSCLLLIELIASLKVEKYGQHGSWERLDLECPCSSRNGVVWQTQRTEVSDWWRKNVLQNLVLVKGTNCRMFGVQICENFMKTESQNWGIKLEETSGGHQVQPPAPRQRQCRLLKCSHEWSNCVRKPPL